MVVLNYAIFLHVNFRIKKFPNNKKKNYVQCQRSVQNYRVNLQGRLLLEGLLVCRHYVRNVAAGVELPQFAPELSHYLFIAILQALNASLNFLLQVVRSFLFADKQRVVVSLQVVDVAYHIQRQHGKVYFFQPDFHVFFIHVIAHTDYVSL